MRQRRIMSLCLAIVLGVCGCNTDHKEEVKTEKKVQDQDYEQEYKSACSTPYGKYPETITYTLGKMTGSNNSNMPEKDTYEDNAYTRYLKQFLNIQNKNVFELSGNDGYDEVVDMAIANGNIPDIMVVSDLNTLEKLVKLDMVEDLTEVYKKCTSPKIKEIYNSYGNAIFDNVTYNGKLMALPETAIEDGPNLLWLRKDWMDKLSLEEPKSLEDAYYIIEQFVRRDPGGNGPGNTIGLVSDVNLSGECGYSSEYRTDLMFASVGAYPKQWIYDKDGKVVYGSVQPEAKIALQKLHELYKKRILDNQFLLRTTTNIIELVEEGQCGSFCGPWWAPNNPLMQAVRKNKNAEWRPYAIPTDGKQTVSYHTQNPSYKYVVVRKGYEHPEIAAKIISTLFDYLRYQDKDAEELVYYYQHNVDPSARPIAINIDYSDALNRCYTNLSAVLKGEKDESELEILESSYYASCKAYLESEQRGDVPTPENWAAYTSRITACRMLNALPTHKVKSLFFGSTKTMKNEWWQLETLERKTYLEIVTGEMPVDEFDKFVKKWYKDGGTKITKEVSRIVEQRGDNHNE